MVHSTAYSPCEHITHFIESCSIEAGYQTIRKWTTNVDIFSKKYVIVPINEQ